MVKFLNSEMAAQEETDARVELLQAQLEKTSGELQAVSELLAQYSLEIMVQQKKVIILEKQLKRYEQQEEQSV